MLTPRTSATRITYDHDFPRRITPFRNLGADPRADPDVAADFVARPPPAVGLMGHRR
ncbi:MAG: hypothetical protein ABI890_06285 [Lapillicoccus sp.]